MNQNFHPEQNPEQSALNATIDRAGAEAANEAHLFFIEEATGREAIIKNVYAECVGSGAFIGGVCLACITWKKGERKETVFEHGMAIHSNSDLPYDIDETIRVLQFNFFTRFAPKDFGAAEVKKWREQFQEVCDREKKLYEQFRAGQKRDNAQRMTPIEDKLADGIVRALAQVLKPQVA